MTDEYEQPSWPDGSQEEITHLFARREYLTERLEAATDPNLRSSFAYEISVLEARLADLNRPAVTKFNGTTNHNSGNTNANNNNSNAGTDSNDFYAEPAESFEAREPVAPVESNWPSDHDEIPEEFYQTLEIASTDLDAAAWPANAARPEPRHESGGESGGESGEGAHQQTHEKPPSSFGLEPVEYLGDEHRPNHTHTVEVQPMDSAPAMYQPQEEARDRGPQIEQFAHVDNYDLEDLQDGVEEPQLFSNRESFGSAHPFDTGPIAGAPYEEQQPEHELTGHEPTGHELSEHEEADFEPADAFDYQESADDEDQHFEQNGFEQDLTGQHHVQGSGEFQDRGLGHDLDRFVEEETGDLDYETDQNYDTGQNYNTDQNYGADPIYDTGQVYDTDQNYDTGKDYDTEYVSEQERAAAEQADYFGRTDIPEPAAVAQHELPDRPERPISAALSARQRTKEKSNQQRRFESDKPLVGDESEVELDNLTKGRLRVAPALVVAGVCLALLAGVLWVGGQNTTDQAAQAITSAGKTQSQASEQGPEIAVANVRDVLERLGVASAVVDYRAGTIHVGGPVPTQADFDSVSGAVQAVAGDYPVDLSALVVMEANPAGDTTTTAPPPAAPAISAASGQLLQSELNRILAVTPLIFDNGQTELTALHQRTLNSAVLVLLNQPGSVVTITGYTDEDGTNTANRQVSLSRAENVKAYLVSQGVDDATLRVEARGEEAATGSAGLAGLERRVEFTVETAPAGVEKTGPIKVAVVAPSARNDLAFTQSMVDAVNLVAEERGLEVTITDNTFVPAEAEAAVRNFAEQGYDLIIAHGSQFGAALIDIAPQFPATAFAWGTASDTFGLPNVYAYDAAAEEGGYVLGTVATMISGNKISGIVAPIDVGDAAQYVSGFQAGAQAQNPSSNVLVSYTGSFSDIGLASEAAQAHIDAGAEVLTGSAQMVIGAISTADQQGVKWFGTQANQSSLAPNSVVGSQVYRWDIALRPILDDVASGSLQGTKYTANLANGGLVIEFNPGFPLAPEVVQRANEVTNAIIAGEIDP